jgi:hypothetical protein
MCVDLNHCLYYSDAAGTHLDAPASGLARPHGEEGGMKQIVQSPKTGKLELVEVPAPATSEGQVLGEGYHFFDPCAHLVGAPPTTGFARALGRDSQADESIVAVTRATIRVGKSAARSGAVSLGLSEAP